MTTDTCPVCGQHYKPEGSVPRKWQLVNNADELVAMLKVKGPDGQMRQLYRAQDNTWHCTFSGNNRHIVDRRLITELVGSGVLSRVYNDTGDAYWLGQTIDMDATMAKRRQTGDRRVVVYASP